MKPRSVYRYPGIYLIAEENLGRPQLGDRLKAVLPGREQRKEIMVKKAQILQVHRIFAWKN